MTPGHRPEKLPGRSWNAGMPCGYCRKIAYPDRRTARRALRALYPGDVGHVMDIYRCGHGGDAFHLGHHDRKPTDPPRWPIWEDSRLDQGCQRCPARIDEGEPVAWLDGTALCFDCGDHAEQEALTA